MWRSVPWQEEKCKEEEKVITAVIEKGHADGSQLRFERMSEQRPGQIPGDVILNLRQAQHRTFTRQGDDLPVLLAREKMREELPQIWRPLDRPRLRHRRHRHTQLGVTLKEALTGFRKEITHLDGHKVVVVKNPAGSPGNNQRDIVRPLQVQVCFAPRNQ